MPGHLPQAAVGRRPHTVEFSGVSTSLFFVAGPSVAPFLLPSRLPPATASYRSRLCPAPARLGCRHAAARRFSHQGGLVHPLPAAAAFWRPAARHSRARLTAGRARSARPWSPGLPLAPPPSLSTATSFLHIGRSYGGPQIAPANGHWLERRIGCSRVKAQRRTRPFAPSLHRPAPDSCLAQRQCICSRAKAAIAGGS